MFSKGDLVGLLNSQGRGRIIHVLEKNKYLVLDEDSDMEIPLHESELYLIQTADLLVYKKVAAAPKESEDKPKPKISKPEVIDLHIEKVPVDFKRGRGVVEAQLAYFEHCIKYCVNQKKEGITFIHGKGNGVLKSKLVGLLREGRFEFFDPERELHNQNAKLFVKLR